MEEHLIEKVNDWFSGNHHLFNLTEYYGIDICCELYGLVKTCIQDSQDDPV